jgi:hypothetical protein
VIDFIASNFTQFSSDSLASLALDDLERLLRHPSLRLRREDDVFDLIASHLDEDASFFRLFECVRFEYLSRSSVSEFAELAVQHFERFTVALWSRLAPCLAPGGAVLKQDRSDGLAGFSDSWAQTGRACPAHVLDFESYGQAGGRPFRDSVDFDVPRHGIIMAVSPSDSEDEGEPGAPADRDAGAGTAGVELAEESDDGGDPFAPTFRDAEVQLAGRDRPRAIIIDAGDQADGWESGAFALDFAD